MQSWQKSFMIQLNGFWPVFAAGGAGFVLLEMIQVASWRKTGKWAHNYQSPGYWITAVCLFVVSGCGAAFNGTEQVTVIKAIQLGISAPALFAGFASASEARRKHNANKAGFMAARETLSPWQRLVAMRAW